MTGQNPGAIASSDRRVRFACRLMVSVFAGAIFGGPARAGIVTILDDPQDTGSFKVSVKVVGSGVAASGVAADTKKANDYAMMYSTNYMMTAKYVISYTIDAQKMITFDPTMSTITFSGAGFTTEAIPLSAVTGDFTKNMFTKFTFSALNWYPNLPAKYYEQNTLSGSIDLSGKAPVVDITSSYKWKQTKVQPAATLTYTTTFNAAPGPGSPFDPNPPGPASVPEPTSLVLAMTCLGSLFCGSLAKKCLVNRKGRRGQIRMA